MISVLLKPGELKLSFLRKVVESTLPFHFSAKTCQRITQSAEALATYIHSGETIYGVNTGFGQLANISIPDTQQTDLQHYLLHSHATGVGETLSDDLVRLILLLKINALSRGFSGIRLSVIEALRTLYHAEIYPLVPAKGSVGASGDLAPLAHLSGILLGIGKARYQGKTLFAQKALGIAKLPPLTLQPKEGLALINGTQVSTALALKALFETQRLLEAGLVCGALSVEAAIGRITPYDARIQKVRGHRGQIDTARFLRRLLRGSEIRKAHQQQRVQDPYSLRCQPQVMGACLDQWRYAARQLEIEANAVSDNPLLFLPEKTILSGGNFHAEPVAFAADALAIVIAEIGALSERRIALLTDAHHSGLPPFLIANSGIHSGFMMAQVTAAALASENKSLAHPASVDSIPTSANQEDHVSMATFAARRLLSMIENTAYILAIELLAACQGLSFRAPCQPGKILRRIVTHVREKIPCLTEDRALSPDIERAKQWIQSGAIEHWLGHDCFRF